MSDAVATPDTPVKEDASALAGPSTVEVFDEISASGPHAFERSRVTALQVATPEFGDVIAAHLTLRGLEERPDHQFSEDELYAKTREQLRDANPRVRSRRAETAIRRMGLFTLDAGGCLFRKVALDVGAGLDAGCVERVVVPAGGLRSFKYNGRMYRLTLRKSLLLLYHDSELTGAHSAERETLAKLSRVVWWDAMERDVHDWISHCSVCRLVKPQPGITIEQRHELHDRPFKVLFIDAIGPISPADDGHSYLYHAECPFTRFAWVHPGRTDGAEEWAKFLVEHVFFDLCGFPAILRSDRGAAFTSSVVQAVNELLGVSHVFGTAFHPQSQGYIEGRHKSINATLAAFAAQNEGQWVRWAKLAQWALRATPRADRGGFSPYELVTGMRPQGPMDHLFGKLRGAKTLDPATYVSGLRDNLESIHKLIADQLRAEFQAKNATDEKRNGKSYVYKVGDHVFLKRVPAALQPAGSRGAAATTTSRRLLARADPNLYVVQAVLSPQTVILADPDTGNTKFSFAQPISAHRLLPFYLAAV